MKSNRERILYFFLGCLSVMCVLLLLGATPQYGPPNYGRYQISSFASIQDKDAGALGVFIVDTATGETKTVYSRIFGDEMKGVVVKEDLRKPFHAIK